MAAGESGQTARLDAATQSLRQALLRAEDDAQRMRALEAVVQRSVVAPTWPNSPEALRTLSNSDGEHAMTLFSAMDTLQTAARRFGWTQPDGSLGVRELPAREALRSALEQGVHYVVLDIFAEHATEFSRDEIAQVLARAPEGGAHGPAVAAPGGARAAGAQPAQARAHGEPKAAAAKPAAARAQVQPKAAAASPGPKVKPGAVVLAEIDLPFASRRNPGKRAPHAVVEEHLAPPRRDRAGRIDPRAEPDARQAQRGAPREDSAPVSGARAQGAASNAHGAGVRAPAAAASAARAEPPPAGRPQVLRAPSTLKEQPAPRAERAARATPGAFAAAAPALEPAPLMPQSPAAMPAAVAAAGVPALDELPSLDASARPPLGGMDAEPAMGLGFGAEPEPEANPAALHAAAMVAQVAKLANDADTQKAAAEVAAMLTDMARKGVVEEPKPSAAQSAAKVLASMLSADAAAAEAKRNRRPESKQAMAAVDPGPASAETSATEVTGLRPLEPPLPDALLHAMSEALRKYPEVEWACEVGDGSAVPVIGVRVDPAFQTRAAEVRAALLGIAQKHKTKLSVLMLSDPQLMKEARAGGSAFFPWRKRAAKR